jgi:hypothetical protein
MVAGRSSEYDPYFFQVLPSVLTTTHELIAHAVQAQPGMRKSNRKRRWLVLRRIDTLAVPAFLLAILEFVRAGVSVPGPVIGEHQEENVAAVCGEILSLAISRESAQVVMFAKALVEPDGRSPGSTSTSQVVIQIVSILISVLGIIVTRTVRLLVRFAIRGMPIRTPDSGIGVFNSTAAPFLFAQTVRLLSVFLLATPQPVPPIQSDNEKRKPLRRRAAFYESCVCAAPKGFHRLCVGQPSYPR